MSLLQTSPRTLENARSYLPTPRGVLHGNNGISQVPVSPLLSVRSCSSTPARPTLPDLYRRSMLPPVAGRRRLQRSMGFRGSIATLSDSLCTLRSDDYSVPTQHSVPAVGQTLPGGLDPQGSQRKVFDNLLCHLVSSLQTSWHNLRSHVRRPKGF